MKFNTRNEKKKSKCKKIHIGKKKNDCCQLKVNGKILETVEKVKFLGNILSADGKNTKN